MKKHLFFFKNTKFYLFLFVMFFLTFTSKAQNITYPAAAQNITRGTDSTFLTVSIAFPANCSNVNVTINLGATNTPGSIEYIPSSIALISASGGLTITESNISNLNAPVFVIGTVAIGNTITFRIKRRANCGIGASSKDNIVVTGTGCNFSETDVNVNTYNLLAPALTLVGPALLSNVDLGIAYNRTFTVTNGGNGCLDTLLVWIKYPTGSATLNSLKIGANTLTAAYTNGDSSLFKITGTNLSNTGFLCNGQTVNFTENVTFIKCNATTEYGDAWTSYGTDFCETDIVNGNVSMSSNTPNVAATIPNVNYNYCFRGEKIIQKLRLTNSGTGAASNVSFTFTYLIPGSGTGSVYFDTTKVWIVRNSNGDSIGKVAAFTNATPVGIYNTACVFYNTAVYNGTGTLSAGIIIPPGGYIDVEINTVSQNYACLTNSCFGAEGWMALQTTVSYKNQCGTANYTQGATNQYNRFYTYPISTVEGPSDINAGPFSIDFFFSLLYTTNHPNGNGKTYLCIKLPTDITPGANNVNIGSTNYPMTTVSPNGSGSVDTLWIGPLAQNVNGGNYSVKIPLIATCGSGGTKNIETFVLDKYDACAPWVKFDCHSIITTLHCPIPCPKGGATPVNFSLKRINFGMPDNDENHIPDASGSINLSLVKAHHAVNGDTLKGTWNIKLYPNTDVADPNYGGNINYVYVDFNLGTYPGPASVNPLANALIKIYPNSNALAVPITCTANATILGTIAHYEFSTVCRGGSWQPNDSIVIEALYTVNEYNSRNANGAILPGFDLFNTNNEVYSSYTQKTTAQIAPSVGQTYTCDHYNDYSQLSRIWISDYIPSNQIITGCTNNLTSFMRLYVRNQEAANIFPYEYRNFIVYDTMAVTIPPGFTYKLNSAILYNVEYSSQSAAIANTDVIVVGNVLKFVNLKNKYTPYGGLLTPGDELSTIQINFQIDPTCSATSGTYFNNTLTTGIGNGINTGGANYVSQNTGFSNANGWVYTAPQPVIAGGGLVNSSDGKGTWSEVIQNLSNSVAAPNSYFFINPKNGFTNIVIKEGATIITPDANGIYQLSSLAASSSRNFTITANTTGCNNDSMKLNFGWNCNGYPTSIASSLCSQFTWLKIANYPSQIQLTVEKQPKTPTLDLCTADTMIFKINSAQAAFADNPIFRVTPPTGFSISKGQIEYPDGSGNWEDISPAIATGVYSYKVEDHSQSIALYGTKGLPGTIDFAGTSQRAAKLRIVYTTTCDFTSGSKLLVQQRADRPCGTQIPNNLGYNNIVRTDPVKITGASTGGSAAFSLALSPNTVGCSASTLGGSITPVGTTTASGDSIIITIPAGVTYTPASFTSGGGAVLAAGSPTAGSGGAQILKIVIPSGTTSGNPINYSFGVTPNNINNGCGNFDILSEYIRTLSPLSCNSVLCPNNTKVVMASDTKTLTINKPQLSVTNMTLVSGNVLSGTTFTANVEITNSSSTIAIAPLNVEFYCGSSTTSFGSQSFMQNIPANGTANQNVTVSVPNTCATGSAIRAVIRPAGGSGQCVCDSASYTWTAYLVPVKITSFLAELQGNLVKLQWFVANEIDVTNYEVQHSVDGVNYTSIASLTANGSASYSAFHSKPIVGVNFYRLRIVDNNGTIKYSEIRRVLFGKASEVVIYPNPVKNVVNINLPSNWLAQATALYLFAADGKLILSSTINKSSPMQQLNISVLPNGTYTLRIMGSEFTTNKQIIIVH